MDISLICTGIRPSNWVRICSELSRFKAQHEVIFVGPKEPKGKLPDNATFICSNVKPAQCIEIAARNSRGKYLALIADDCAFWEFDLDVLLINANHYFGSKKIIGASFKRGNWEYEECNYRYWADNEDSPKFIMSPFFPRELWLELGGIDSNFLHSFGDLDLQMRALEAGYKLVRLEKIFLEELIYIPTSLREKIIANIVTLLPNRLRSILNSILVIFMESPNGQGLHNTISHDRSILDSFWVTSTEKTSNFYTSTDDGLAISRARLKPVSSFFEKNILIKSQGPRGKW